MALLDFAGWPTANMLVQLREELEKVSKRNESITVGCVSDDVVVAKRHVRKMMMNTYLFYVLCSEYPELFMAKKDVTASFNSSIKYVNSKMILSLT